mmetsp:Transcript_7440/g.16415  ORF Transcript_7440/g.16415 Transcript_7440/m.16415 type:complete len:690 (-) Transcript_7440:1240-3309(-)
MYWWLPAGAFAAAAPSGRQDRRCGAGEACNPSQGASQRARPAHSSNATACRRMRRQHRSGTRVGQAPCCTYWRGCQGWLRQHAFALGAEPSPTTPQDSGEAGRASSSSGSAQRSWQVPDACSCSTKPSGSRPEIPGSQGSYRHPGWRGRYAPTRCLSRLLADGGARTGETEGTHCCGEQAQEASNPSCCRVGALSNCWGSHREQGPFDECRRWWQHAVTWSSAKWARPSGGLLGAGWGARRFGEWEAADAATPGGDGGTSDGGESFGTSWLGGGGARPTRQYSAALCLQTRSRDSGGGNGPSPHAVACAEPITEDSCARSCRVRACVSGRAFGARWPFAQHARQGSQLAHARCGADPRWSGCGGRIASESRCCKLAGCCRADTLGSGSELWAHGCCEAAAAVTGAAGVGGCCRKHSSASSSCWLACCHHKAAPRCWRFGQQGQLCGRESLQHCCQERLDCRYRCHDRRSSGHTATVTHSDGCRCASADSPDPGCSYTTSTFASSCNWSTCNSSCCGITSGDASFIPISYGNASSYWAAEPHGWHEDSRAARSSTDDLVRAPVSSSGSCFHNSRISERSGGIAIIAWWSYVLKGLGIVAGHAAARTATQPALRPSGSAQRSWVCRRGGCIQSRGHGRLHAPAGGITRLRGERHANHAALCSKPNCPSQRKAQRHAADEDRLRAPHSAVAQ